MGVASRVTWSSQGDGTPLPGLKPERRASEENPRGEAVRLLMSKAPLSLVTRYLGDRCEYTRTSVRTYSSALFNILVKKS